MLEPPPHETENVAKSRTESATRRQEDERARRKFQRRNNAAINRRQVSVVGESGEGSGGKKKADEVERAVVVMVTVALAFVEPSSVADAGEMVQVAAAGAPEQVQVTVLLKPPLGERETVKLAVSPAVTVLVAGLAAATKSGDVFVG